MFSPTYRFHLLLDIVTPLYALETLMKKG